jgi:hypothetical protein
MMGPFEWVALATLFVLFVLPDFTKAGCGIANTGCAFFLGLEVLFAPNFDFSLCGDEVKA